LLRLALAQGLASASALRACLQVSLERIRLNASTSTPDQEEREGLQDRARGSSTVSTSYASPQALPPTSNARTLAGAKGSR
jgi:hypothetical protein